MDTLLAEYDYDLAADGKRTGVSEKTLVDAVLQETRIDWLYDPLGRLTQERYDSTNNALDYTANYVHDLAGNRLEKTTDRGNDAVVDERITYGYDANDRLLTEIKDDLTAANEDRFTEYEYGTANAATQQTKKTVHEGLSDAGAVVDATTYAYNLQGRMSQVQIDADGNGTVDSTSQYEYADDGTRVNQAINGTKTLYVVDGQNPTGYSQVLEEKDAAGNITKSYTLGLDIISQQAPAVQGGGVLYLLKDGHGSTRGLVDVLGMPLSGQVYAYDAFGNPIGFNPANALTSHLYNSEAFNLSTGLYNFRARLYDPRLGRFPTMDSFAGRIVDPPTLHKYLFAHGDGINFSDPSGQFEGLGGLLSSISIQTVGRGFVTTYSLGAKVWAQRMILSVGASVVIQFYAWQILPPLWKELHGLAGDVRPLSRVIADKIDLAGDYVEARYWSITSSNVQRVAISAVLAPWPNLRLGVGIASLSIAGKQIWDMLEAVNAHIVTLNEVAKDRGLPVEVAFEPNIGGIFSFVVRGAQLQLDPAGQVHQFRQALSSLTQGDIRGMKNQLVGLGKSLFDDYGHMVRVKLHWAGA